MTMGLVPDSVIRAIPHLVDARTGRGIPSLGAVPFSPRTALTNAVSPTGYKLAWIEVVAGGSGYTDGAAVTAGAPISAVVGTIVTDVTGAIGPAGAIVAVSVTNQYTATLTSAPSLSIAGGGSGATIVAKLEDPVSAARLFKASQIDWTYIGNAVDSGGTTDASEAAFLSNWASLNVQPTANSKPNASGVSLPGIVAAVAFGGEVVDADEATYGGGVGYASLCVPGNVTAKVAKALTSYQRVTSKRIQHDDPAFQYEIIGIGGDFSATAIAGFQAWLMANTTQTQRDADYLTVADMGDQTSGSWNYKTALIAWFTAKGIASPSATATYTSNRRTLQSGAFVGTNTPGYNLWRKYQRSTIAPYFAALRSALGSDSVISANIFNAWPVSPKLHVGGWQNTQGCVHDCVLQHVDYADTEWATRALLNTATGWSDLAANFAVHARAVQCVGKRITGCQQPLDPRLHKAALCKTFLRQGVSFIYALGATCSPCWDTYVLLGNSVSLRYWMSASDYGGIHDFIATHQELYDGFQNCPTVALVVNGDQLVRDSSATWTYNSFVLAAITSLLAAGTPFEFSMYSSLDTTLARNSALESAVRYSLSTTGSNPTINEGTHADNWAIAATAGQLNAANAFWISRVTGASGTVYAIPRVNLAKRQMAVHICNLGANSDGTAISESALSLEISVLGRFVNKYSGTIYRPGLAPSRLEISRLETKDVMALPAISDLGAIVLLEEIPDVVGGPRAQFTADDLRRIEEAHDEVRRARFGQRSGR